MIHVIDALLTGKARIFGDGGETSAIAKDPVEGPHTVGFLGIAGDEQADLSVHGGPDKAIHHYPRDHSPFWTDTLGPHPLLAAPGAFGETLSTHGMVEGHGCLGDSSPLGCAPSGRAAGRE